MMSLRQDEIDHQIKILRRGTEQITPFDEFVKKITKSIEQNKPLRIKLGLDPSAPDIHIGHTVVLEKLRQFQSFGHIITIVIGTFTGQIGDPTGKSETRKQLTEEQVMQNALTYQKQIFKILDPDKTEVHYNGTWLATLTFSDVVRLASTFTVARMLERDDFKKRFTENAPISIHEFFYPLMQGYDSVALASDVELGGTDQTFNLLAGRTLQKEYGQEQQIAITMPILEGLDGKQKMSKSLGNYIGVSESASEIYGKAMSIPDELMLKYYELVSGVDEDEFTVIKSGLEDGTKHPRDAKMRLAYLLTARFQGEEAAQTAQEEFIRVFQKHALPEDIPAYDVANEAIGIVALLVTAKLAPSNSEARRLIAGGGVRIDGEVIHDDQWQVLPQDGQVVQVGKRRFIQLRVQ